MTEWWPLLLGWPALLAALAFSGFGTFNKRPWNLYVAAILILPISLYLGSTPRFAVIALLPPVAFLGAGIAIRLNKLNLAWALIFSVITFFIWLVFIIQKAPV